MKRLIARVLFWTIVVVMLAIFAGCMACLVVAASTLAHVEFWRSIKQLALFVGVAATTVLAFIWAHENK
jgi:hypothetical protein